MGFLDIGPEDDDAPFADELSGVGEYELDNLLFAPDPKAFLGCDVDTAEESAVASMLMSNKFCPSSPPPNKSSSSSSSDVSVTELRLGKAMGDFSLAGDEATGAAGPGEAESAGVAPPDPPSR